MAGEGKLACPTCAAKIGKWSLHSTAADAALAGVTLEGLGSGGLSAGVVCSCGVLVPAPAYGAVKQRLDIIDQELDIASAVQSALQVCMLQVAGQGLAQGLGHPTRQPCTHTESQAACACR